MNITKLWSLALALALAACTDAADSGETANWVDGKADGNASGPAQCPGPYQGDVPSPFFQGLRGSYLRGSLVTAKPGELLQASFSIDPPDATNLATGSYAATAVGVGVQLGAFQEANSITVPAFMLIPAGMTAEQADGYIVINASTDPEGTLSLLCVQRLLHGGRPEQGAPFELHGNGL